MAQKRVVILGAGFAGLQLARNIKDSGYDITIIDQYNFHQFQPLFYQVATARLEPSSISFPLRKIFQGKKNVHVRVAKGINVDIANNLVETDECNFQYDYLIVATGCTTNFFGNKNLERYAYPMKSTTEAITLRNRILLNFEDALHCSPDDYEGIMNIVVAGGGPTGVEMAGSLAEMKKYVLPRDYPDMDFSKLQIHLVEGGPATLGAMSKASQRKSQEFLERMGVKVWTNTLVEDYDGRVITLKDGKTIRTSNLIWAAGVTGNLPTGIPKETVVRGNRIKVDEYNRVEGHPNIFALGDIAYMETKEWPKGHPQLANVAINQAKHMAKNMKHMLKGGELKKFTYKNPGTMATIGKRKAVVDLPAFSFQGFFAWLFWMFLHLMLILSVKNKLIIFINWAISYFTNDTTLRLILLPTRKQIDLAKQHHQLIDN
ncbi:NAD(P)/FAD-dependent oxidoreductase [Polluticoccus soli]|uniref:NAD(P)/FAD-dependent oxidoreductase n=1 Tax=Polluticoccus soli TaxID=3034150 RepID=UPI0023E22724|nr:NAD(P)/FAD-dependent oxidoreductase [Flavipsychrobacter sp. JY13-12]